MADATKNPAAAAGDEEEADPSVWPEVTTALESYKDVEVRNWTRELVLQKEAIDERLWRCHPLTELTIVVPRMDVNLGGVGYLKNLVTLVVRDCGLAELPRSLSRCTALKNLDCSNNPTLTYLPEELCTLRHLDSIRACHCAIDTIRDLEGCDRVSQLFLNSNLLTELDGPTLGTLTHLIHFEASDNAIDEIPAEIEKLAKSLQVLDLNDNCITEIPQAFGALKKLVRINLSGNEIADKQMLRVVKAATTEGAKKLKNFVTHCKKKGKKTKPTSTKRPKFVRVTRAERIEAEQKAAEAAAAAAAEAAASGPTDGATALPAPSGDAESKETAPADGWGTAAATEEWGAEEGGGAKASSEPSDPKEVARLERRKQLLDKRAAALAATEEGRRALEEEATRLEKQREAEREAALEKQRVQAEIEAELEEKKRLEEEAEQARFDALPEEEKQRILAERAAEQEKAEAERQALLAENKAKRDAIAAKEEARLAAKRAESEKERAEAMAAQQAQAQSKLAANKRYTGIVLKFDKAKRFGFIRDEASGKKLFVHIDMLMHEAQSVSVQASKRKELDVGMVVEYNIDPPRGKQPLGKAVSVSLPGFKPFPRVFS